MLTFRHDYVDELPLRDALKRFLRDIHGLDLGLWERCGYWDRRYMPFSYFDGDEVVSSVSVYSLDMVVSGTPRKVAQISGVGTREDLRRRGLNRALTERAMQWAREAGHASFFLFSDQDAVPFYRRMGFHPADEWTPSIVAEATPHRAGATKLDMERAPDRLLVEEYARRRTPVSDVLGVNSVELLMFHALHTLRDALYHIPDLDLIAAVRTDGEAPVFLDVIGPVMPTFAALYPYFGDGTARRVSFGFLPDRLGLDGWDATKDDSQNLHFGGQPLFEEGQILFPFTARA